MPNGDQVDPKLFFLLLWRRRRVIWISALVFGAAALGLSLLTPKSYRARALVGLPEAGRPGSADGSIQIAFSVAETRALLEDFPEDCRSAEEGLKASFGKIVVEPVRGSGSFVRIGVTAGLPEDAVRLAELSVHYLAGHPAVEAAIGPIRNEAQARLDSLMSAIGRMESLRERTGAPEAEVALASLRQSRGAASRLLEGTHSYRLIAGPKADPEPAAPKPMANTVIYSILGFMASVFASLVIGPGGRASGR